MVARTRPSQRSTHITHHNQQRLTPSASPLSLLARRNGLPSSSAHEEFLADRTQTSRAGRGLVLCGGLGAHAPAPTRACTGEFPEPHRVVLTPHHTNHCLALSAQPETALPVRVACLLSTRCRWAYRLTCPRRRSGMTVASLCHHRRRRAPIAVQCPAVGRHRRLGALAPPRTPRGRPQFPGRSISGRQTRTRRWSGWSR